MAKIHLKPIKEYPDVSHLFKAKEEQRLTYANRTFAEKLEVVKRLNNASQMWQNSKIIEKKD